MKLQHLAIGARFEYEGEIYVKTGPLTASGEKSGQRIIPRYAVLRPLDVPEAAPEKKGRRLIERDKVLQAFDVFFTECSPLVGDSARADLVDARERFLKAIG